MKEIPVDVPGDEVKLLKNAPPIPTNVKLVFDETDKPLYIFFRYDRDWGDFREMMEYIRRYSHGFGTGYRFTKEQLVFDGEFCVGEHKLHIFNMLLKNANLPESVSDDEFCLILEMSYEHFYWDL